RGEAVLRELMGSGECRQEVPGGLRPTTLRRSQSSLNRVPFRDSLRGETRPSGPANGVGAEPARQRSTRTRRFRRTLEPISKRTKYSPDAAAMPESMRPFHVTAVTPAGSAPSNACATSRPAASYTLARTAILPGVET